MFQSNMMTEPIPARVFALYKIVASKKDGISRKELNELMEPPELVQGKTSYFQRVLNTAIELNMIINQNDIIRLNPDIEKMKNISDFRYFVSGKMEDISEGHFYKVTSSVLKMSDKVLSIGKINSNDMLNFLSSELHDKITDTEMNGWRFWVSFFGFGYIEEKQMSFIPDSYIFLRNVIKRCQFDTDSEIPFDEFLQKIDEYYQHISDQGPDGTLNIAFSNALRQMHVNNEIRLVYRKDRQKSWNLYPSKSYFNDPVTDIVIEED